MSNPNKNNPANIRSTRTWQHLSKSRCFSPTLTNTYKVHKHFIDGRCLLCLSTRVYALLSKTTQRIRFHSLASFCLWFASLRPLYSFQFCSHLLEEHKPCSLPHASLYISYRVFHIHSNADATCGCVVAWYRSRRHTVCDYIWALCYDVGRIDGEGKEAQLSEVNLQFSGTS